MIDIAVLATELEDKMEWQRLPEPVTSSDYKDAIRRAIRRLYVDTGRASVYDTLVEENEKINVDMGADELEYTLLVAQINLYRKVQNSFNTLVSYTTNALKVTNGEKPFEHIEQAIVDLDLERRRLFYRMYKYSI